MYRDTGSVKLMNENNFIGKMHRRSSPWRPSIFRRAVSPWYKKERPRHILIVTSIDPGSLRVCPKYNKHTRRRGGWGGGGYIQQANEQVGGSILQAHERGGVIYNKRGGGVDITSTWADGRGVYKTHTLTFTRYSFTSMIFCANQSFVRYPPHLHCPHHCHTIARLLRTERLLPDPPLVSHTPYNIGHDNVV